MKILLWREEACSFFFFFFASLVNGSDQVGIVLFSSFFLFIYLFSSVFPKDPISEYFVYVVHFFVCYGTCYTNKT